MLLKKLWTPKTRESLRVLWAALLIAQVLIMMGCTHGQPRKNNREIWLIDNEEMVLYRRISEESETVIPLKSKSMDRFMCIDKKEFDKMVEDWVTE